ncbi:MAG: hypothetical protein JOZ41_14650 [Chloroflexi bacterium]|nr:hypothetical protein [Chloroflexota bacterium]
MSEEQGGQDPLDRELAELGPVMLQQERLEAEPLDPAFAGALRGRLTGARGDVLEAELVDLGPLMLWQETLVERAPDPGFVADLRARLTAPPPVAAPRRRWPRIPLRVALAAAALVAVVAALVLLIRLPRGSQTSTAWIPPTPNANFLTKSYPLIAGLGGGGFVQPAVSRIDYPPGSPFPGRLQLSAGSLPRGASRLRAFRLARSTFDDRRAGGLARRLGIQAAVSRVRAYEGPLFPPRMTTWVVVAQGGAPAPGSHRPGPPLRSLAISTATGQLIYHDLSYDVSRRPAQRLPDGPHAAAAARQWLSGLGWPGAAMPQMHVPRLENNPGLHVVVVDFGWAADGASDVPGATLWVAPGGRIVEALLWPPVVQSRRIAVRSIAAAWRALRAGQVPTGVWGLTGMAHLPNGGTGTFQRVYVMHVFTQRSKGRLYLVPVYRFEGTARLQGARGVFSWFALVPAARS